jgi:UPF0176 protein
MSLTVASFYKFVPIADGAVLRTEWLAACRAHAITGTILIAPEGINATVAGDGTAIEALLGQVRRDVRFSDLTAKLSQAQAPPFRRLKVKLKREIVTFGRSEASPSSRTGTPVTALAWNALLDDPATVLIDTRNAYETAVGTFPGALDPKTSAFGEFPDFVRAHLDPARHRKIAMFCTGGIRCEKASAYLLSQGFTEVYQLQGGILKYLEDVPPAESRWQGECYVFDGRVALQHGLAEGSYAMRRACGHPLLKGNTVKATGEPDAADTEPPCALCAAGVPI